MAREKPARTIRFVFMPYKDASQRAEPTAVDTLPAIQVKAAMESLDYRPRVKFHRLSISAWQMQMQMQTQSPVDIAWWNSLTEGSSAMKFRDGVVPSAWLTHPVYLVPDLDW